MKKVTISLMAVLFLLCQLTVTADPIDSLVNITIWEEADGGNGHTYAILKMTVTWDSARIIVPTLIMNDLPGYLATITSQAENNFIMNNNINGVGEQPTLAEQFFLGGEDQNNVWVWLNGEQMVFVNWSPGEPNNEGIETALSIWGFEDQEGNPPGKWNNTLPNLVVNPHIRQWSVVEWDACCIGIRGDVNGDSADADVLDLSFLVDRIFRNGPSPVCFVEADVNSDGASGNILDLTFLVDRIFRGGPAPGACI